MTTSIRSLNLLSRFPAHLSFAFAYGSGVKLQRGYTEAQQKATMIDMVFCVDNPIEWHAANLRMNASHYSALARVVGVGNASRSIAAYQERFGAGVYCNTLVRLPDGPLIKYGVISTRTLCDDLTQWRHLYMAGRLHKPVAILCAPARPEIDNCLRRNLQHAVNVALLLLPASFSAFELFACIANLSYGGDFRMIFGEKKDKVRNIVEAQLNEMFALYRPTLLQMSGTVHVPIADDDGDVRQLRMEQDKTQDAQLELTRALPDEIRQRLGGGSEVSPKRLDEAIKSIVWQSSVGQSLKNIPTAGLTKTLQYSWKKVLKSVNI